MQPILDMADLAQRREAAEAAAEGTALAMSVMVAPSGLPEAINAGQYLVPRSTGSWRKPPGLCRAASCRIIKTATC